MGIAPSNLFRDTSKILMVSVESYQKSKLDSVDTLAQTSNANVTLAFKSSKFRWDRFAEVI